MELYKQFETDTVAEVEGVWVDLGDGGSVKVARLNNPNHKKALDHLRKPYKNMLRTGRGLPDDVAEKISSQAMAEAILLDWKGLKGRDGKEVAYSPEKALELLMDPALKDFRDNVAYLAMEQETFRKEALETAAKNSDTSSPGS